MLVFELHCLCFSDNTLLTPVSFYPLLNENQSINTMSVALKWCSPANAFSWKAFVCIYLSPSPRRISYLPLPSVILSVRHFTCSQRQARDEPIYGTMHLIFCPWIDRRFSDVNISFLRGLPHRINYIELLKESFLILQDLGFTQISCEG